MRNLFLRMFVLSFIVFGISGCSSSDEERGQTIDVEMKVAVSAGSVPLISATDGVGSGYRRRFIVDVYQGDEIDSPLERKIIIYDNVNVSGDWFRIPVRFRLAPKEYTVAVWTDYIVSGTEDDLYYNTSVLSDLYCRQPYQGNTPFRDALSGTSVLNLSEYRGQTSVKVQPEITLERPVVPFRLIANDWERFVGKYGVEVANGAIVTVNYNFYFSLGFDVLQGRPARSQSGVSFSVPLTIPGTGEKETLIASDYIFSGKEESFTVVNLEIKDKNGSLLTRIDNIKVPYRRGYLTTIKSNFLTSEQASNVDIDVSFEEDINIDLDSWMN